MLRNQLTEHGFTATLGDTNKIGLIGCLKIQLPHQTEPHIELTFKPFTRTGAEPNMAYLLSYIMPDIITPTRRAYDSQSTLKQNSEFYNVSIYVNASHHTTKDRLDRIMLFISENNLIEVLKEKIGALTPDQLSGKITQILEKAQEIYCPQPTAGSFTQKIDFLGINKAIRTSRVTDRFDIARKQCESDYEALLMLLNDASSGKSLRAYRYALTSALLGVTVNSDDKATLLIELTRNELGRKLEYTPNAELTTKNTADYY